MLNDTERQNRLYAPFQQSGFKTDDTVYFLDYTTERGL